MFHLIKTVKIKMDLYFIECVLFTKNKNIEVKHKIDKKIIFTLVKFLHSLDEE